MRFRALFGGLFPVMVLSLSLAGCNGGGKNIGSCLAYGGCITSGATASGSSTGSGSASIYFYNELTDSGTNNSTSVTVNLTQSGTSSALLSAVPYSTTSNASATTITFDTTTGQTTLNLERTSDGLTLGTNTVPVSTSSKYTVVAMGDVGNTSPSIQSFQQSYTSAASNQVRIRFINTLSQVSNTAPLEVDANGTSLVTGLSFGSASGYVNVPATGNSLSFTIKQAGSNLATSSCTIQPGNNYDAILAYNDPGASTIGVFCHLISP